MRKSIIPLIMSYLLATTAVAGNDQSGHADHSDHEPMHEGVQTEATINSIDDNSVNLSHGPIPEIGWPAMTMDLQLQDGADIGDVSTGQDVLIVLEKGEGGMYAIRSLRPLE